MSQRNRQLALLITLIVISVIVMLWFAQLVEKNPYILPPIETTTRQSEAMKTAIQQIIPTQKTRILDRPEDILNEQKSFSFGALDLLNLDGQPTRPTLTIVDQVGERESELFFHDFSQNLGQYTVYPGIYTVQIEKAGAFRNVIIKEEEMTLLQFGAFDLRGPKEEPVRTLLRIFEQRQSGLIGPLVTDFEEGSEHFVMVPGSYTIQVDGAGTFHGVTIRPGEITPLYLGAYDLRNADGSISRPNLTIIDQENGEQISKLFADFTANLPRYYLVPGAYRLEIEDSLSNELIYKTIEIKAGEEVLISLP